jgi:ChpA-C
MRPWAEWTAKTALVAVGFAAAGGGLSSVAYADTGDIVPSASDSVLSTNNVDTPLSLSADVCGIAGALLGIASADCRGGAVTVTRIPGRVGRGATRPGTLGGILIGSGNTVSTPVSVPADVCGDTAGVLGGSAASCAGGAGSGTTIGSPARTLTEHEAAPLASVLGSDGPLAGLGPVSSLTLLSGLTGTSSQGLSAAGGTSGSGAVSPPRAGRIFAASSGAGSSVGSAGIPSASQLAGLGTLPGLADLPSLAGLANMPALSGGNRTAVPWPGTTLSAADAAGMSSNSYAALAVGSLLAGASALKIAGRRARDRKAGMGVAI